MTSKNYEKSSHWEQEMRTLNKHSYLSRVPTTLDRDVYHPSRVFSKLDRDAYHPSRISLTIDKDICLRISNATFGCIYGPQGPVK